MLTPPPEAGSQTVAAPQVGLLPSGMRVLRGLPALKQFDQSLREAATAKGVGLAVNIKLHSPELPRPLQIHYFCRWAYAEHRRIICTSDGEGCGFNVRIQRAHAEGNLFFVIICDSSHSHPCFRQAKYRCAIPPVLSNDIWIGYEFDYGWRSYRRELIGQLESDFSWPAHFRFSKPSSGMEDLPYYLQIFAVGERKHAADPDALWRRKAAVAADQASGKPGVKKECRLWKEQSKRRERKESTLGVERDESPDIFGDGPLPDSFEELERRFKAGAAAAASPSTIGAKPSPATTSSASHSPESMATGSAGSPKKSTELPSSFVGEPIVLTTTDKPQYPVRKEDEAIFLSAVLYASTPRDSEELLPKLAMFFGRTITCIASADQLDTRLSPKWKCFVCSKAPKHQGGRILADPCTFVDGLRCHFLITMCGDGITENTLYYPVVANAVHGEHCPAREMYDPHYFRRKAQELYI